MSRLSTCATSTLVPALKVLSTTLPLSTFFSVVRTKAPPLPGLTCWNSTTDHSPLSSWSTMPFLRSFVEAMRARLVELQRTQRGAIALHPETGDGRLCHRGDHRGVPELLPRGGLGQVHLDEDRGQ